MDNNVIKTNQGFHVQEDFYEALINGLQCERDKEKQENVDEGGKILSFKQQKYLRRITAPLIISQMSNGGLLGDYMSSRYNSYKTKKILEYQRKAYAFLKFYQEQDEDLTEIEEEKESEAKRLSFMEMYKLYRTLRRLWGLYDLYKTITSQISTVEKRKFNIEEYDLNNPEDFNKFQGDFNTFINGRESYIISIMEIIMREVTIALYRSVDRAFDRINMAIYSKIAWMAAQAIAEQVAWHFVGGILEATGIGFVMHAAGAARAANWARKIGNYIGGIKNVARTVQRLNSNRRILRAANAFQTFNNSFLARTTAKITIGAARAGIQMYNIVTISNQELEEMERLISNDVQRRTSSAQAQLRGRVEAIRNVRVDFSDTSTDIANRIQSRIDTINVSNTDYSFISQKYKRDITIRGVEDSKLVTTLSNLGNFFSSFWNKMNYDYLNDALKETYKKVTMTDKGFSSDSFEIFFSKTFHNENEKPIWWNTNRHYWMHQFMQVKVNSDDFDMYYLGLSQGFSAYFMKNGRLVNAMEAKHERIDYSGTRVVFLSGNKSNFERIYTDGIESGFKLRFSKAKFYPGRGTEYEDYNLNEKDESGNPKYKIYKSYVNGAIISITRDGELLINMRAFTSDTQEDTITKINNVFKQKEDELKEEKALNENLKKIQKIIEEKLRHQDEEQVRLREDAIALVRQYNSLQTRKSRAIPGITPGSMVVVYEDVKVTNYDPQRWTNIINKMSSTQLRALIARLNRMGGSVESKIQEITNLNQVMYGSH